ncbi:DMT family transporter [Fodinisporobacter ferrooxydans]|uniref:DMT family transporter n=1 Tax=Fodinisporobacter ferrooxydans TaxID=2901836 RepID=A0ABY4CNS5_9BACL|nr:DMT family transporter [Alicyclobacillaceae bacterium MYW30-H2]
MNSYEKEIDRQNDAEYSRNLKKLMGPLLVASAAILLGSSTFIKTYYPLHWIPPWTQIWIRYLIATITLGMVHSFSKHPVNKEPATIAIAETPENPASFERFSSIKLFGIAFTGYFISSGGIILGQKPANEPTATLLLSSFPMLFMFFLGIFVERESLSFRKLFSVLVTLSGIGILILKDGTLFPFINATTWYADSWLLISAFFWAFQAVLIKQEAKTYSTLYLTLSACGIATLLITPLMIIELWKLGKLLTIWQLILNDFHIDLSFLYLGIVVTAAAFYMWNRGIELMDLSKAAVLYTLYPLTSQVLQAVFVTKDIGMSFEVGAAILLLGMYWMIRQEDASEQNI